MIEYIDLAEDLKISRVLTGLWQIADLERHGDLLDPIVTAQHMMPYVDAGFTTFDMADHYGSAEVISGVLKNQKSYGDRVQLFTKWVPTPRVNSKQIVREAVQRSLDRMQSDKLDMLQYHAWNYCDPEWLDTLFWLQELKEEGLIGHLGLTNFDAAHLRIAAASGIDILTNQISYSVIDQRGGKAMKDVCHQYGIKILAFGTLAGGFLSEKWLDKTEPTQDELSTWSQMKYKRFIDAAGGWSKFQNLLSILDQCAKNHGSSIANITSRYMLDEPHVAGIILGTRLGVSSHVTENLNIFNIQLSASDRKMIKDAMALLERVPGGCGDEYRKPPFLTASGDLSHHIDALPAVYHPIEGSNGKSKIDSGTSWESLAGYSRAVRSGDRIMVSGTTATHGDRIIGGTDPAAQAHFVLDKIKASIESLGGQLEDVDRTRIYVNNLDNWEPVARAHGEVFKDIRPANTLVQAGLVGEGYLVEIEAEARVSTLKDTH
jgi:aryl-alcohol dehydrogenase-like predicted oxidoreductase/enamine deaminase RidA (YjgF/YER057c/UK114 family)